MNDSGMEVFGFINVGEFMGIIKGSECLLTEAHSLSLRRRAMPFKELCQTGSRDIFHDEEVIILLNKEFEDTDYIRMIELRLNISFASKSGLEVRQRERCEV